MDSFESAWNFELTDRNIFNFRLIFLVMEDLQA